MSEGPESGVVSLAVLAEMVERAQARTGLAAEPALLRALERGLTLLESSAPADAASDDLAVAARFDALRARALLLADRIESLEAVVYEQADQSSVLQNELWRLRVERDAARTQLGRSGPTNPRPEPPLTIGLGGPHRQPPPIAARLLRGQQLVRLEVQLPPELSGRLQTLRESPTWPAGWTELAALYVAAHGLAALERDAGGSVDAARAARRIDPLNLSTLHRQVLEWEQAVKVLRLRQRAFELDNAGMRQVSQRLRDEVAGLLSELAGQDGPTEQRPGRGRGRFWPFGRR